MGVNTETSIDLFSFLTLLAHQEHDGKSEIYNITSTDEDSSWEKKLLVEAFAGRMSPNLSKNIEYEKKVLPVLYNLHNGVDAISKIEARKLLIA